jgi:UDP-N-acetylmuramoyl-tripeptide--D-alanyl-D-alanine ligase
MKFKTLSQIGHLLQCTVESTHCISGVCVDTRLLELDHLFFALPGERVDGHAFLQEAALKGAAGAVVCKSYQGPDFNLTLLRVDDPLSALQDLAARMVAQSSTRIVAITGSLGKTTVKDFIKALLSTKYRVMHTPGNSNSKIGLPLAILNHMTGQEEILVLEMGMTHPGQLLRLVHICPPEVAVITSVALVHACNFDSLEDIAKAKAEILLHSGTRVGIIPREICNYDEIMSLLHCQKISFSTQCPDADYYLNPQVPQIVEDHVKQQVASIGSLKLPGRHNLHNLLAAVAVARYFDVSWEDIAATVSSLQLPERRLQQLHHKGIHFVNDAYNAAELSIKAALEALPQGLGNKVAVLGSMMELGKFSWDCHERVGEFALNYVDQVYCLGEECQPIYEIFKKAGRPTALFLDRQALVEHLKAVLRPNDVVLLKGSRSKELWKVLEEI